ncbi:MAG: DUF177 domain-containing protein [Bacteroidetes bacterium]|nr:DUF177 domain-containing protein [Bacteroidota bacterium]
MDKTKPYHLHFGGLKPGMHHYTYAIDESFFELFEESEVKSGQIGVDVQLEKKEGMQILDFNIKGTVHLHCDRCYDFYDQPIKGNEQLIVKFADTVGEDEEVVFLPFETKQINLAPYLYEYIHLLIPMRRIHPDDDTGHPTCNPAVLDKLEHLSTHKTMDERWNVLKTLKNSQKKKDSSTSK